MPTFPVFRIGFGYDVHAFCEGRPLMLGGVLLPHSHGLAGHSDADVLLHAVCDALLGAANLRDIGFHFPPGAPDFKNISSLILLEKVNALLSEARFAVGNVDCTVVAEAPKINPFVPQMQNNIGQALTVSPEVISIKATTNEKMGFVGREEGICAYAVALIYKI